MQEWALFGFSTLLTKKETASPLRTSVLVTSEWWSFRHHLLFQLLLIGWISQWKPMGFPAQPRPSLISVSCAWHSIRALSVKVQAVNRIGVAELVPTQPASKYCWPLSKFKIIGKPIGKLDLHLSIQMYRKFKLSLDHFSKEFLTFLLSDFYWCPDSRIEYTEIYFIQTCMLLKWNLYLLSASSGEV